MKSNALSATFVVEHPAFGEVTFVFDDQDAGGFASLDSGEDRALHGAIVALGGNTHVSSNVKVVTSGRRKARAPRGFSYALCTLDRDVTEEEKIA